MKREDVIKLIEESKGHIFRINFIKRTTGELRKMRCRIGVKKDLKGNPPYDAKEKQLIHVYDMDVKQYRSIPYEGIIDMVMDKEHVEVDATPE